MRNSKKYSPTFSVFLSTACRRVDVFELYMYINTPLSSPRASLKRILCGEVTLHAVAKNNEKSQTVQRTFMNSTQMSLYAVEGVRIRWIKMDDISPGMPFCFPVIFKNSFLRI